MGRERTRVSPIRNFLVRYRARAQSQWTESSVASDSRTFIVRPLSCGTEYQFTLLVTSLVGNSSDSNTITAKTKGSPPEYSPSESDTPTLAATSVTIYVTQWQDHGCPIQQFIFGFRTADSGDWIIAGAESPPQRAFLLGGLQPATDYVVGVTATNAAGSARKEYTLRTADALLPSDYSERARNEHTHGSLAPLFADPRVAVPIAVSTLAILLTAITLILRYLLLFT